MGSGVQAHCPLLSYNILFCGEVHGTQTLAKSRVSAHSGVCHSGEELHDTLVIVASRQYQRRVPILRHRTATPRDQHNATCVFSLLC